MKIALTGGPSAGKTTIALALVHTCWRDLVLVPEGASLLFHGGFPRDASEESILCQQRAIYHVQKELENVVSLNARGKSLICDRGTLDGLAYWPKSESEFFENIKSKMDEEIARYDFVIHLETADEAAYQISPIRIENFERAQVVNERIKEAWRKHPKRILLNNSHDFQAKINSALKTVDLILKGKSIAEIMALNLEGNIKDLSRP